MNFFSRKRKEDVRIEPPASSRVEVELHKSASAEAAEKAKEANKHLNELLVANGFTLKIYLAAGGQLHNKKRGGTV
jgi:hypothetical protein